MSFDVLFFFSNVEIAVLVTQISHETCLIYFQLLINTHTKKISCILKWAVLKLFMFIVMLKKLFSLQLTYRMNDIYIV